MPPYEIRESSRAKHLRITVYPDGRIVVTKPVRVSMTAAARFAEAKRAWASEVHARLVRTEEKRKKESGGVEIPKLRKGSREYRAAVEKARSLVTARLSELNAVYGFTYGRISIRNQSSRWGSCSQKGNLNFNYKIAFLPPALADYLLIHELCHLKEMNHSARFWQLVAKQVPDYMRLRKQLRAVGLG